MAFCTNCGKALGSGVNFCPGCGTRVAAAPPEAKIRGYKEKMFKGVEQRLKTTLQGQARSAAEKVFSKVTGQEIRESFGGKSGNTGRAHPGNTSGNTSGRTSGTSQPVTPEEGLPETHGRGVSGWIWIFLLLSILLGIAGFISYGNIEAWAYGIGRVLALSTVILIGVLFRRKKEKPLNWLFKILLLAQILFLGWILYNRVMGQYFDMSALLMAALLSTDLKLLFNGNK